jgi:putative membrane protein
MSSKHSVILISVKTGKLWLLWDCRGVSSPYYPKAQRSKAIISKLIDMELEIMSKTVRTILTVVGALIGIAVIVLAGIFVARAGFHFLGSGVFGRARSLNPGFPGAGRTPFGYEMGPGMMGVFTPYGWLGVLFNLAILAALGLGVVLLIVWLARRSSPGISNPSIESVQGNPIQTPREILQVRYARGEITREEYHQMLEDLS